MRPTSILLLASAIGFSAAAPANLEARICGKVLLPSTQIQLKEASPNTAFPNTALTDKSVAISQSIDSTTGKPKNKVNELISFSAPPASSYGCTLGLTFPAGYTFSPNSGPAARTLNIYSVNAPLPSSPTYNNIAPKVGSLFGTVTVSAGQSTVINAQSCPGAGQQGLSFVFEYPDWVSQAGSIGWKESNAGQEVAGAYLSYNC